MSAATKNAIMKALVEGAVVELMIKSDVDNIYVDETTTLATKLAEIITTLGTKASTTALENGLSTRPTTEAMNTAISTAISELIDGAPETYNTLKELADYISAHEDVVDTLNAAIGNKADLSALNELKSTVDGLGSLAKLNEVSEDNLSSALKEKVNAASEGNHSHNNKALLDTYTQTEADLKDAVSKKHRHTNAAVLDGIEATDVSNWDSKGTFYVQASQPANLAAGDLWAQIID